MKYILSIFFIAFFTFSIITLSSSVSAITDDSSMRLALVELANTTGRNNISREQARELCNQPDFFVICGEIGKKFSLYPVNEVEQAEAVLAEFKTGIVQDIKKCPDELCLIDIANSLAQKLDDKHPNLIEGLDLGPKELKRKRDLLITARDIGVSTKECKNLDFAVAPTERIRSCANLLKDDNVKEILGNDADSSSEEFDSSADLKVALNDGTYNCGDGTVQSCSQYCLRVSDNDGLNLCSEIALHFFGKKGQQRLEESRKKIKFEKQRYEDSFSLRLPNGEIVIGESAIRKICKNAIEKKDIPIIKLCADFSVTRGFATRENADNAFNLFQKYTKYNLNLTFDECIKNPERCKDVLSNNEQDNLKTSQTINRLIKERTNFDIAHCKQADGAVNEKCVQALKQIISELDDKYEGSVQEKIKIEEIKEKVIEHEGLLEKTKNFDNLIKQEGGPGNCTTKQACRDYCADPIHVTECISFGTRARVFNKQEAAERFKVFEKSFKNYNNIVPIPILPLKSKDNNNKDRDIDSDLKRPFMTPRIDLKTHSIEIERKCRGRGGSWDGSRCHVINGGLLSNYLDDLSKLIKLF